MPAKNDAHTRLQSTLLAIPAADVREPATPMAVFNQQGNSVVTFLASTPTSKSASRVGVERDELLLAIKAAEHAIT